uniref:zinc-ribbon domain-containing protein n=1 Tax=Arthrobacter sp. lap29 TaxID=3056122 RepID=UPI0028F6DF45
SHISNTPQCGRQEARRTNDMGCTCQRNSPSSRTSRPSGAAIEPRTRGAKNLLCDSDNQALAWWDHKANDDTSFKTVTLKSRRECWWTCPECGHQFSDMVYNITSSPRCGACHEQRADEYERYKTIMVREVPELLAAWADPADPSTIEVAGSWMLRRFRCPKGHHPKINPYTFLNSGCPSCRGQATRQSAKASLRDVLPEIAEQWHPVRNGSEWTPDTVGPASTRVIWWKANCCGFEWEEAIETRNKFKRQRCPRCATILDSLGWADPGLAAEWSDENPMNVWQVRPTASTRFIPKWVCSINSAHRWEAPLTSRSSGSECPECCIAGKSKVELEHLAACANVFTNVRSGPSLRSPYFTTRQSWTVDILASHDNREVAIEYDGAYWHSAPAKIAIDQRKTQDLLAAGYTVVRLREDDLPSLEIQHKYYFEVPVFSAAPRPQQVISDVLVLLG